MSAAVVDTNCPEWCTDHSPFGMMPISVANPGIHQTQDFSDSELVEVRIVTGVDEPTYIQVQAFDSDVYIPDAKGLRDLGEALLRAASVAERFGAVGM